MKCLKPKVETVSMSRASSPGTERIRGSAHRKIRQRILERDGYACRECGRATIDGEVDHIIPLSLGGQESDSNREYICRDCHQAKSEREEKDRIG